MKKSFILSNHNDTYLINFKKAYDLDYIKFLANKACDENKTIDEILNLLTYNYEIEDVFNIDDEPKVWCK